MTQNKRYGEECESRGAGDYLLDVKHGEILGVRRDILTQIMSPDSASKYVAAESENNHTKFTAC